MASQSIQSVQRALSILEILRNHPDGLGVTEISNRLDVAKSTAFRLLFSLLEEGYVQKDDQTDHYRLGLKLLQLGNEVAKSMDLRRLATPYLKRLVDLTGETTHLAVYEKGEVVYIDKLESSATIRMYSQVGLRAPAHCTGLGKAMLSGLPDEEIDRVIETKGLQKFTETTLITRGQLMEALKEAHRNGYAFDDEEHERGVRCAAAPIFNFENKVIAGISVAGPTTRISQERMRQIGPQVSQIAKEISREMGF
ncbi:HTH-type transcriptional regulator XynR [Paenibacillus plantiphilus]|uniref:HTH-type transcriptional regulator XynR n=1 Tax=Paenibacillus plantiphilus TaxID=2905650 RepID=A0ABM9CTZ1_9BACL|nr:IclR family transcriptional regulator [Paenibacillus plantiphilus]CAH1223463.1 HTH-type transcriptional regulator XynR [Paenibacillus plantiphilus]